LILKPSKAFIVQGFNFSAMRTLALFVEASQRKTVIAFEEWCFGKALLMAKGNFL
jgi:hypothetical protein